MRPRSSGLPVRLVCFTLLPLFALTAGGAVALLHVLEREMERRLQEEVQMVGRALQLPVSHAIEHRRPGTIQRALDSAFQIGRVYGAYLYDTDGALLASSGAVTTRPPRSHILKEGRRTGTYEEVAGRNVYSYFVPLESSAGRSLGLLHVTRRQADFRSVVRRLRWTAAAALGGSFVLMSLALGVGYHGALGRGLSSLRNTMSRIRAGDRDYRAAFDRGPREIVQVGETLNSMLDAIDQAESRAADERQSRLALERRLREAETLAALGRLSAGVAHELGSPLTVLDAHAQRALRRALPDEIAGTLRAMREEVRRMERIVGQLLAFGRAEQRKLSVSSVAAVAATAARAVEEDARQRGVAVALEGARPGPQLPIDADRVHQALVNLLRNAIYAARARVALCWRQRGDRVEISVEDDGPGIPAEVHDRLYEPFFTTKPPGEGTGLGLSIVYAVAREHGASIDASDSDELSGACFTLSLPTRPLEE